MRYIRYLEAAGDMEGADSALQRALQVHCKRRPATHLFAARCEELRGGIEQARTRYAYVITTLAPGLVSAVVAAANFERRQVSVCEQQRHILGKMRDIGRARKLCHFSLQSMPPHQTTWDPAPQSLCISRNRPCKLTLCTFLLWPCMLTSS